MRNPLKSLFGRSPTAPRATGPVFDAPLAPDAPFVAIGDIHGRADLLARLLTRLEAEDADKPWVFLGDYVDRGAESAQVLARLRTLQQERPDQVICLMGNHEKMLRDFLDDPVGRGARWLRFGGLETLQSFGIETGKGAPKPEAYMELCEAFEEVLPAGLMRWLDTLPLSWQSGNVACVHAAMDPDVAPADQSRKVMLWGHPDFFHHTREDDTWVVHGHTIVKHPTQTGGRIAIDTGAYQSGTLTAARISAGTCAFISA